MANIQDDKVILVTKEGLKNLKEELDELKNVKRKEIAARIKEAISYGDLSENSEYEEAKNEQAFVEGRILELEEKIKYAKIIDSKNKKSATVQIGSKVTILNKTVKKSGPQEVVIVGSTEADWETRISNESPVGSALLDKNVGDVIEVKVPLGPMKYEILSIK